MIRTALSRAASVRSGRSTVSVTNNIIFEARFETTNALGNQTIRNLFPLQLRQISGPTPASDALQSTKDDERKEDKPTLSLEQSTLVALETKGVKQPKRPDIQALASSFLGGAYLVRELCVIA